MSVLDVFYILFKSQGTDEVKKSEDDLKRSGDNLNQSMKESASISQKMGESFNGLANQLAHTITAALSLGSILHSIKNSIDYAQDVDLASRELAVNVEDLDAWDNAVQRAGGTAQQFQGSLRNLAQQLGTSGQIALQVLPQLADSFQQMGRFASIRYGQILGLDENTILLLQKGRREVEDIIKQQKELGVVSKKDAEAARELNFAWKDATHSLRMAFMSVSMELMPALIEAINLFGLVAKYFKNHSDLIVGGLVAIGTAAIFMNKSLFKTISLISLLVSSFSLVYEDIKYFIEGYDSFVGRLLAKFPLLQKELITIIRLVHDIKSLFNFLNSNRDSSLYDSMFGYDALIGKKKTEENKEKIQIVSNKSENGGLTLTSEDIARIKSSKLDHVKKVLDIVTTSSVGYMRPSDLQKYAIPTLSGNKTININTGPVTINTESTDSQGVAQSFTDYFSEQITQANNYFDDGVKI